MIWLAVQLVASLLLSGAFAVLFGWPWKRDEPAVAWFIASTNWAAMALDVLLLLAMFGIRPSLWVAALVLGLQDVAVGWRLWVLLRQRGA